MLTVSTGRPFSLPLQPHRTTTIATMDMAADKSRIFLLSLLINANGLARLRLFSAKLRIFLLTDHRSRLLRGLAVVFQALWTVAGFF